MNMAFGKTFSSTNNLFSYFHNSMFVGRSVGTHIHTTRENSPRVSVFSGAFSTQKGESLAEVQHVGFRDLGNASIS